MVILPSGMSEKISAPLLRQKDGYSLYIFFTGGIRASNSEDDLWQIEPIYDDGKAYRKGLINKKDLQNFAASMGIKPIAFGTYGWIDGRYYSSWKPIFGNKKSHLLSPPNLWSNIAANISECNEQERELNLERTELEKIAEIYDDQSLEESLSRSISLSLRSMEINIEQIAEHYFEQLVDTMYTRSFATACSTTGDQTLFAHVHSFFLHLGAARDYLAAFIAKQIGIDAKTNSLEKLRKKLLLSHIGSSPMLEKLISDGLMVPPPDSLGQWDISGWLRKANRLRNILVHERPYGSKYLEKYGSTKELSKEMGVYRHFRIVCTEDSSDLDLLDVINDFYQNCMSLFENMADLSGFDKSMMVYTDNDIISIS